MFFCLVFHNEHLVVVAVARRWRPSFHLEPYLAPPTPPPAKFLIVAAVPAPLFSQSSLSGTVRDEVCLPRPPNS